MDGPEGASFAYMKEYLEEIERRLMPYTQTGEVTRLQVRAPRSFSAQIYNTGQVTLVLNAFGSRRSAWVIIARPMAVVRAGGTHKAFRGLPPHFFTPVNGPCGWIYVAGFAVVMLVSYNASWSLAKKLLRNY